MNSRIPRKLALPPAGRPHWIDPGAGELLLLGWGRRYHGHNPLPVTLHTGWPLVVILRGSPTLVLANGQRVMRAGDLVVLHPDCACGWTDQPRRHCDILSWVWRKPPAGIAIPDGGFAVGCTDEAGLQRLTQLHAICRREIAASDALLFANLAACRTLLESEVSRIFQRTSRSEGLLRFQLAVDWLNAHIEQRKAIALLREYLDVSALDLQRLFRQHAGCAPSAFLNRLRMERARMLLEEKGLPAKTVAYSLGYAHPNDFSRAFAKHFRRTVRALQQLSASRDNEAE